MRTYAGGHIRLIIFVALVPIGQVAMAETVQVKYHGLISLAFACEVVKERSAVSQNDLMAAIKKALENKKRPR